MKETDERLRNKIAGLFKCDEAELYRSLGEPPTLPRRVRRPLYSYLGDLDSRRRTSPASELRQARLNRAEGHKRAANDLRRFAENEIDGDRRARLQDAAEMNDSIAETLYSLATELQADVPTAYENRVECEERIREIELEHRELTNTLRDLRPNMRGWVSEKLIELEAQLENLRAKLEELKNEEWVVVERTRPDWVALEDAKRLVAEADGRAKFNALVPDIRTRLCAQWHACEQVKKYEDEAALTMAIGDVLMTLSSTLPVATLAVLVVKIGVKKFCNCPS